MNIFYFSEDPVEAARAQPDKMLVKMPLESAQMLCTAHRVIDGDEHADEAGFYKKAHMNHPCSRWVRECSGNYAWLYRHFIALGYEYTYRYKRTHASLQKFSEALYDMPKKIPIGFRTEVAQAMPEEYRNEDSIFAYRNYVINEKHYAKWEKGRTKPSWWEVSQCHL
jgi:hypothetical protein|tara:strand:- start:3257 stop:3757 length:501 start_codon:yes stop_codon:yes gene_type:complete